MSDQIKLYYTTGCGDCKVATQVFEKFSLPYDMVDIERDPEAQRVVQEINGGYKSVPTILLPSGAVVVEPTGPELISKLREEGLIPV